MERRYRVDAERHRRRRGREGGTGARGAAGDRHEPRLSARASGRREEDGPRVERARKPPAAGGDSRKALANELVRDLAVPDHAELALPRQLSLHARRKGAAGGELRRAEHAAECLVDPGDVRHEPDAVADDLEQPLVVDRLAPAVEADP